MSTLSIHQKSCPMKLSKFVMNILNVNLKVSESTWLFKILLREKDQKGLKASTEGPQKHRLVYTPWKEIISIHLQRAV